MCSKAFDRVGRYAVAENAVCELVWSLLLEPVTATVDAIRGSGFKWSDRVRVANGLTWTVVL